MSKGFSTLDNPSHQGKTDTWLTPLPLIKALGEFDLDPCYFPGHLTAKEGYAENGLEQPWIGRVWMNPPYGRETSHWLRKLEAHGNGIALLFARTDTSWFHEAKPDAIMFLRGRIRFLTDKFEISTNAGHGSMLLAYGFDNVRALFNSRLEGKISL